MTKEYNLKENPSFCMLGLLHTYVGPDGNIMPCCVGDVTKESLGNLNDVSDWTQIWNGEKYKQFRRNMIEGKKNSICSFCYDTEKFSNTSSRKLRNEQFKEDYDLYISNLLPTGEMKTSKLKYLDFRFSNRCNQACITCGHSLSSSWYDLQSKLTAPPQQPKFIEPKDDNIAYKMIDDNLDSVTHIYFAGGEPMLSKFHWYTLEKLVESGRSMEVDLVYSSNCSVLTYHGKNVLEYWKNFKNVMMMASIDEVGDRFNYIRWPGDWERISKNLKQICDSFDEINSKRKTNSHKLCYAPVLSSLNVHRIKEILLEFMNKKIFQNCAIQDPTFEFLFFCNLLRTPRHLSIMNMPEQHWSYVDKTLSEFEQWYCEEMTFNSPEKTVKDEIIKNSMKKIRELRNMQQEDMEFFDYKSEDYLNFMENYSKIDQVRATDFRKTFPELEWLYK